MVPNRSSASQLYQFWVSVDWSSNVVPIKLLRFYRLKLKSVNLWIKIDKFINLFLWYDPIYLDIMTVIINKYFSDLSTFRKYDKKDDNQGRPNALFCIIIKKKSVSINSVSFICPRKIKYFFIIQTIRTINWFPQEFGTHIYWVTNFKLKFLHLSNLVRSQCVTQGDQHFLWFHNIHT